jgi:uncharacterized protein (TIGR02246 family)
MNRTLAISIVALALVAVPLGHAAETSSLAATKKAIAAANAKYGDAVAKGDAKTIRSLYTDNAYVLPPGMPAVHGGAAIEELWGGFFKAGAKAATLATEDVERSGDLAAETGTYTFTMQPEGKPAATTSGKYVVVWKHQKDGGWKLHRDIWNANAEPK